MGRRSGKAQICTEGMFDAICCTLVLGIPCAAVTAPSHLRKLEIPGHVRTYVGDCDQWMAKDLLPSLIRGCVSKGMKVARLPLVEKHRADYLGEHRELPGGAKGGMEELLEEYGVEGARSIVESIRSTAGDAGEYLKQEIKELGELGIRWPDHAVPIQNLISAMADAHPNNAPKRDALKEALVLATGVGRRTVNEGIKGRLQRRRQKEREERAEALARGEKIEPSIDRKAPTSNELQQFCAYHYSVRFNELTRLPELDGNPITDVKLFYQLLAQHHDIEAKKAQAQDALLYVAQCNAYNPVAEYLQGLKGNDAIEPMAEGEIFDLFGLAPADPLSQLLLKKGLAGTVKRGLDPGCKFDACPILRGPQGNGKTETLRSLGGAWFDGLGDYGSSSSLALSGWSVMAKANASWIFELGEVDRLTRGRCQSAFKDWLTERVAKYAEKHEPLASDHPRRFVSWGTTNESELLNDETGNRRFWIIECPRPMDWRRSAVQRDRIWKAALLWLDQNDSAEWLDPTTDEGAWAISESSQRGLDSTFADPWVAQLLAYLEALVAKHQKCDQDIRLELAASSGYKSVATDLEEVAIVRLRYLSVGRRDSGQVQLYATIDDLHTALGIDVAHRDKGSSARLGKAMRNRSVVASGWVEKRLARSRGFVFTAPEGGDGCDSGCNSPVGCNSRKTSETQGPDRVSSSDDTKNGKSDLTRDSVLFQDDKGVSGKSVCSLTQQSSDTCHPSPNPCDANDSRVEFENCIQGENVIPDPAEGEIPAYSLPEWATFVSEAADLPDLKELGQKVGLDFETFNERTDRFRHCASLFPWLGAKPRLVSIHNGDQCWVIDIPAVGDAAVELLRSIARNPEMTVVGHNLLFEAQVLLSLGIRPICRFRCTMLAAQLLRAGRSRVDEWKDCSLAGAVKRHLGRDLDKTEQSSDWGAAVLTEDQIVYSAKDAQVPLELLTQLEKELEEEGMLQLLETECAALPAFAQMNLTGFRFDIEAARKLKAEKEAAFNVQREAVEKELGITNYRSQPQLKPALQKLAGLAPLLSTKKSALEALAVNHRVVVDLLGLRTEEKRIQSLGALIAMAEVSGGNVFPNLRQIGAASGRTACPGHYNGKHATGEIKLKKDGTPYKTQPKEEIKLSSTMQGIPGEAEFRSLFRAPEGHKVIDGDWTNVQFRVAAAVYEDDAMIKIASNPKIDVHALMAKQAKGDPVPESLEVAKGDVDPQERSDAKACTFAQLFGCGVNRLQQQLTEARGKPAPRADAERMYRAFHGTFRQLDRAMERFGDRYPAVLEQRNLAGRKLCTEMGTPFIRTDGINYPIQSIDKEMLIQTLGRLWKEFDSTPEIRFAHETHDEIALVAPEPMAGHAEARLKAAMEAKELRDQFFGTVPLDADVMVGDSWADVH